jgi:hypothetical protein
MMSTNEGRDTEAQREHVSFDLDIYIINRHPTRLRYHRCPQRKPETTSKAPSSRIPVQTMEFYQRSIHSVNWRKDSLVGIARMTQLTPGKHTPKPKHVPLAQSQSRNLTDFRKWCIISFIGAITFLSTLSSSMYAPGISFVSKDLHNSSQILGSWSISIFLLGYSVSNTVPPMFSSNHKSAWSSLPQPTKRNLRPPHCPQPRQHFLLRLHIGLCTRTESWRPHHHASVGWAGRVCMPDAGRWCHQRLVLARAAWQSHVDVFSWGHVRSGPWPYLRRFHCSARRMEMGPLGIVHRRVYNHRRNRYFQP